MNADIDHCTICAVEKDMAKTTFYPLFLTGQKNSLLTELGFMFFECIFPAPNTNSDFQAFLCELCQLKLIEFNDFRQMAIRTYEKILESLITADDPNSLPEIDMKEEENEVKVGVINVEIECINDEPITYDDDSRSLKTDNNNDERISNDSDNFNDNLDSIIEVEEPNLYPCTVCNRTFKKQRYLSSHQRAHPDLYKKKTNEIKKLELKEKFKAQASICKICGKTLCSVYALQEHEFRHTGLRPYNCKLCGKDFKGNSDLRSHLLSHKNYRRYQCTICGLRLRGLTHHSNHMETHSSEKAYECEYCHQKLKTKQTFIQHIETVHLNPGCFSCQYCKAVFGSKKLLLRHVRKHAQNGLIKKEEIQNYLIIGEHVKSKLRKELKVKRPVEVKLSDEPLGCTE